MSKFLKLYTESVYKQFPKGTTAAEKEADRWRQYRKMIHNYSPPAAYSAYDIDKNIAPYFDNWMEAFQDDYGYDKVGHYRSYGEKASQVYLGSIDKLHEDEFNFDFKGEYSNTQYANLMLKDLLDDEVLLKDSEGFITSNKEAYERFIDDAWDNEGE